MVHRSWVFNAIAAINADFQRCADTHMIRVDVPGSPATPFYLKDESTHPSGSLKHRLARSLFLYGLCNGWIREGTTVVEASSGSTAVSEAYFARLLGLPFIAVVPGSISQQKIDQIEFYGGQCHQVADAGVMITESERLARECGGHFMNQFTFAERATDWRGNNNIAESLFAQMRLEAQPAPAWVVVGAGTGGTSATIGRFIRYHRHATRLCVVDPDDSALFDFYQHRQPDTAAEGSRIEGIGRPSIPGSFLPDIVDRMLKVPDRWSIAAMLFLEGVLGRRCGASTGTNLIGAIEMASHMNQTGTTGSIVSLICDAGQRYSGTYYDVGWRRIQSLEPTDEVDRIDHFYRSGEWESVCVHSSFRTARSWIVR